MIAVPDSVLAPTTRRALIAGALAFASAVRMPSARAARDKESGPASEWKSLWVTADGADLHTLDAGGSDEPLILLHAGTGSALSWDKQLPAFKGAGYRPIAWSRRGHAWTRRTRKDAAREYFAVEIDDLDRVAQALGVESFHLLGSAAGGMLALAYAVRNPGRLRSLTVATTSGAIAEDTFNARFAQLIPQGFEQLPADFRELSPGYRAADPQGTRSWIQLHRLSMLDEHGNPQNSEPRGKPFVKWKDLEALRMPVLLLAGGADLYSPPPVMAEIAAHLPTSSLHVFPTAGHSPQWECPDAFNAAVTSFLKSVAGRR